MNTRVVKINPQAPEIDRILDVARVIHQGGLAIFPTETVYGIAADSANPQAMSRLREVKKRSDHKPFAVLIAQKELIRNYTPFDHPKLFKLIDRYWPGPLTVIVPSAHQQDTIGIRIPDHPVALKLVEHAHCTIAAPSANFEGNPPPLTCEEALRDLNGLVDVAIDSGRVDIGKASTIVDFTSEALKILREGVITAEDVKRTVNVKNVLFVCTGNSCRSVMAEYLFKKLLKDRNDIHIESAGTSVMFPGGASYEAVSVLDEGGADARGHVSRPVTNMLLKKSDLIFVMTRSHRQQVLERVPGVEKRVYLLGEFSSRVVRHDKDLDIADPVGRGHKEYQECLSSIGDCLERIKKLV